ncbi:MAG: YncE family protein [Blastocatellia bacterium]
MFSATLRARWFSLFPSQWLGNRLAWIVFVIGYGASAAQAAPFAYVANNASNTLSVVDLATGSVVRTITGLRRPTAVAVTPDGRFVYVINDDTPRDIPVINAETGAIVNTIFGIPVPRDLVFSPEPRLASSDSIKPI